MCSFSFFISE